MTPLRQRMIRAMELHRLTQATKDAYLQAIVQLAKFHSRSPDQSSGTGTTTTRAGRHSAATRA